MRFLYRLLERIKKDAAECMFRKVAWARVGSVLRLPMDEVLGGCEDVVLIEDVAIALKSPDCGNADLRDKVRILRIHLLDSSVPRISAQIENRSEYERVAKCTRLQRHG